VIDPLVQHTAALLIAAILVTAATGKLSALAAFEGVVANYRLLPRRLARPFAYGLPFVEFGLALMLIIPATRVPAAVGAILLLTLFAAAMAVNIARGRTEIDCGCFGAAHRQRLSWWLVGRNAILMMFLATLLVPSTGRAFGWLDIFQLALAVAALFLVYLAASGVWLPRPPTFDENFRRTAGDPG
jgi:hypothetical protein